MQFNEILESAGIELKFKYMPFADDLKKNFNMKIMNMSLTDFFSMDFQEFIEKYDIKIKIKDSARKNYEHNKSVLEDLKKKNMNFDFINKTYIQLYDDYLKSEGFKKAIDDLKKKEKEEYIEDYILKANTENYIKYFSK